MLQRVQTQIRQPGGLCMTVNTEDTTLVVKFIRSYLQVSAPGFSLNYLMSLLRIQKRFNFPPNGHEERWGYTKSLAFGIMLLSFRINETLLPGNALPDPEIESLVALVRSLKK